MSCRQGSRASLIVEPQIAADRSARITDAFIGPQIYLFVFDGAPQTLDEHIVPPSAFAIHADRDALLSEHASEGQAGECSVDERPRRQALVRLRRYAAGRADNLGRWGVAPSILHGLPKGRVEGLVSMAGQVIAIEEQGPVAIPGGTLVPRAKRVEWVPNRNLRKFIF